MTNLKKNARELRQNQTCSEGLLWSILRARQLCGLRFRRQHIIEPWIVDFACVHLRLIVEIDGGYHDVVGEHDLRRESQLTERGWTVLRFSNEDVEEDPEAVARAIAAHLGLDYDFRPRKKTGSGMRCVRDKKSR